MKAILKTLLFVLTVVILSQCEKDDPQVTIPDNNFLNALIELGVDTNGDGKISPAEAEVIISLDVSGTYDTPGEIENLTGIEAFINLDTLICYNNQITTLDVSNNTALKWLACGGCLITSLDVSNNTTLEYLSCYGDALTTLDVSNNITLTSLHCSRNHLTTLDVSNNTALEGLSCGWNQLTTLDVSNNTALKYLYCSENQLTTLDVSKNIALGILFCSRNQLTSLDISNNIALGANGIYSFRALNISQMPSLYEVCVWTMPFPPPGGVGVDTTDSPNVYFTTDCSK